MRWAISEWLGLIKFETVSLAFLPVYLLLFLLFMGET